jgi:hypothetical protein
VPQSSSIKRTMWGWYTSRKLMAPDQYHHIVTKLSDVPTILPNIGVSAAVLAVMGTGITAILVQAVTPAADISWIEHLTLEGALVVAVGVLWRALSAKDAQLVKSTEAVTSALASSAASNAELRKIIEHLNESLTRARQ